MKSSSQCFHRIASTFSFRFLDGGIFTVLVLQHAPTICVFGKPSSERNAFAASYIARHIHMEPNIKVHFPIPQAMKNPSVVSLHKFIPSPFMPMRADPTLKLEGARSRPRSTIVFPTQAPLCVVFLYSYCTRMTSPPGTHLTPCSFVPPFFE